VVISDRSSFYGYISLIPFSSHYPLKSRVLPPSTIYILPIKGNLLPTKVEAIYLGTNITSTLPFKREAIPGCKLAIIRQGRL